jgi:site-specific DNA-methyltransferase (cytosine-N4-specific)
VNWLNRCHFGDVREVLRRMIADDVKVNTIVTSPPYWGLRDYGHDGQIGLEPTFAEFLAKMVDVFGLLHQVLADDGTAWVNMGDSYAATTKGSSGTGKNSTNKGTHLTDRKWAIPPGCKPKDLVGQPWRLAFALQDAGWWLRQDIIWNKPNPMPESVRDRCTKAHEYIFLLAKSERYHFDFEAFQEPVNGGAHERRAIVKAPDGWASHEGAHGSFHKDGREKGKCRTLGNVSPPKGQLAYEAGDEKQRTKAGLLAYAEKARKLAEAGSGTKNNTSMDEALAVMPSTRNRRSVWTVASEPYSGAHFATFPTKLIEPCILAGCPAGGVVLDPFFGSGTTGQVAQQLGRKFIGIELNPAYKSLQDERLRQGSLMLEAA